VPIILCTGYSDVLSEEEIQKAGILELVMKPVSNGRCGKSCAAP